MLSRTVLSEGIGTGRCESVLDAGDTMTVQLLFRAMISLEPCGAGADDVNCGVHWKNRPYRNSGKGETHGGACSVATLASVSISRATDNINIVPDWLKK